MYEIKILADFSAAHQLSSMINKKCESLHGHNWKIEVCIRGNDLDENGILIDFSIAKKYLENILVDLDHKFLNELIYFENISPSSENIAKYIANQLKSRINNLKLKVNKVSVWESEKACASYYTT